MLFNSWPFIYLLVATFVLYHTVLARTRLGRHTLILIASYVFYGWWDWRFLSLIAFSTLVDYIVSLRIGGIYDRGGEQRDARGWVTLSIVTNLSLLGFFKYFNFFADNVDNVLSLFGMTATWTTIHVILPVGISFYTFQSMAYTIDIYRQHAPVCRNFITFATYVSFFPQLVAGPIERSYHLIPQFDAPKPLTRDRVYSGLVLLLMGFFKKIAIADPIAPYVNEVLADPGGYSGQRLLMTLYLFCFQLYADFSGYSDIARGAARLFGIDLIRNFEQPFFSTSKGEFWRRWHISLMSWFRDYFFIPLGGSRVPERRVYFNIMLVMTLSGLWHGAGWNWLVWGALNGFYLCAERWAAQRRKALGIEPVPLRPLEHFARSVWVVHLLAAGAVMFLNHDFEHFTEYVFGLFSRWSAWSPEETTLFGWLLVYVGVTVFHDRMQIKTGTHEFPLLMKPVWAGLVIGIMLIATIFWSVQQGEPYFYFQF